jgi:polyhydroxyalkanoate synthesis repressor PhaR
MPILVKRYANRKLYNTEASRYITLKGISELVREGKEIRVIDNETGQDITPVILSQVLADDRKHERTSDSENDMNGRVLAELIQRGGDALYSLLKRGVEDAQGNIEGVRANVRRWMDPEESDESADVDHSEISRAVHSAVERVLRVVDLPTRTDVEALNKNLERLASALESFEARLLEGDIEKPTGPRA